MVKYITCEILILINKSSPLYIEKKLSFANKKHVKVKFKPL